MRSVYFSLCVLGTALPCWELAAFVAEHGAAPILFVEQLFANHVSAFFGWDVIVSALVLWAFVFSEGPRSGMRRLWIYVACTLAVGVSLALPAFLYAREGVRSREAAA